MAEHNHHGPEHADIAPHGAHDHAHDSHASERHAPGHDHSHGHGHAHAPADFGQAFAIGIALNLGFVIIEAAYGFLGDSMALLADAGHNLSDVLSLVVAWGANVLAKRPPSARYTYGLRGSSILAALFNAVLLLLAIGAIANEAIQRFWSPQAPGGLTIIVVAAIGILVNGFTAWLFARGRHGDINIRGAYLHMAADALVSAGVAAAGAIILLTGWNWIDPLASLAICAIIVMGTWGLLRESLRMSIAGVPNGVDPHAVRKFLTTAAGVTDTHDLHIWSMSATEIALTCHLVMPGGHPGDPYLHRIAEDLRQRFGICHVTIQIETDVAAAALCALAPDAVV